MQIHGIDVRNLNNDQIQKMINDFTAAGWKLKGGFCLGENDFHKFIQFVWDKDTDPVMPDG